MFFCCLQKDHREESISVNTGAITVAAPSDAHPGSSSPQFAVTAQLDEPDLPQQTTGPEAYPPVGDSRAEAATDPSQTPEAPADANLGSSMHATKKSGSGITDEATSDHDRVFANDPRRHTNGSLLPPEEFCVKVKKESKGSGLGMDFEMVGEMVVVEQVLKGPVSTWSSTNPGFEVRPADRVVEVNGGSSSGTDMMDSLNVGVGEFVIIFRRPQSFEVNLLKRGQDLGMALLAKKNRNNELRVTKLKDTGVVPEWNKTNEDRQLLPGDRIVQVNNFTGSSTSMLDIMRQHAMLDLRILRPN
mmetsp:Transcript_31189/g.71196  ORF Transcript_31189/g.71196 Transcript_31189/m.71196 type:complete len:302 (+) Transcript_31189:107-1012(+)